MDVRAHPDGRARQRGTNGQGRGSYLLDAVGERAGSTHRWLAVGIDVGERPRPYARCRVSRPPRLTAPRPGARGDALLTAASSGSGTRSPIYRTSPSLEIANESLRVGPPPNRPVCRVVAPRVV